LDVITGRFSAILTFVQQGGWVMVPLVLSSIVALTVCIELAIALRRRRIIPGALSQAIEQLASAAGASELASRVEKDRSPLANVVRSILMNRSLPRLENQEELLLAGRQEAHRLERGLIALEIIAAIAPLLGLLGMVDVFDVVSKEGIGQAATLSVGIKKALYTTVMGLIVAIPCLIAHSCFGKRVDDLVLQIERYATLLLNKLYLAGPSGKPKAPRPAAGSETG